MAPTEVHQQGSKDGKAQGFRERQQELLPKASGEVPEQDLVDPNMVATVDRTVDISGHQWTVDPEIKEIYKKSRNLRNL